MFRNDHYWTLFSTTDIRSQPSHLISLKIHFNTVLLPKQSLPFGFLTKILHVFFKPLMRRKYPVHFIQFHVIALMMMMMTIKECKLSSSSLCSYLSPSVASFALGLNIILNTLFSDTVNPSPFLNVRDEVSRQYKMTGMITFLRILIFAPLGR